MTKKGKEEIKNVREIVEQTGNYNGIHSKESEKSTADRNDTSQRGARQQTQSS